MANDKEKPEANSSRQTFEYHNMVKTLKANNPVGTASAKVLYVLCKTEAEYKVKCGIPLKTQDILDCKRAAAFAGKDGAIFDELFRKSYLQECRERARGSTSSPAGNDDGTEHDYEIYARSLPINPLSFIGQAIADQMKKLEEDENAKKDQSSE
ncbi:Oidioi.mRNA.OKI2018_I69.chr1.g429.t1.cds [Oikopleura dioica]|uniref:Oidioi.mRNA.OKI2018_I69.chr1.g429.t1.cds n=1 Tax=Oikopleura dioica TaxID=34765 RepID=A0ABN7SLH3_OIKDI|nr:Oidioi.mRNA.OKI2018_I69.chr1.g429.t1.cds [Oikopleura dioica]